MKSAAIPQVRVTPEVREELEAVLHDGESISEFVESAVREAAQRRRAQAEFIARGLTARDTAQCDGVYFTPSQVDARLGELLEARRKQLAKKPAK